MAANFKSAIKYLRDTFSEFVIISVYASDEEINILFSAHGKELELFANKDPYFNNNKFVIIEN